MTDHPDPDRIADLERQVTELRAMVARLAGEQPEPETDPVEPGARNLPLSADDMLDVSIAADRFGILPDTLRKMCREGKVVAVKPRGRWFVSIRSLRGRSF